MPGWNHFAYTNLTTPKLIIRMLPPLLKEEDFWPTISKYDDQIDWRWFEPGELPKEMTAHITFTVAYVRFTSVQAAIEFSREFNGRKYEDQHGGTLCQVEVAVNQKIGNQNQERDPLEGTIFDDPDYLAFCAELEKEKETPPKPPPIEEMLKKQDDEAEAEKVIIKTPLMKYVEEKLAAERNAEQRKKRQEQAKLLAEKKEREERERKADLKKSQDRG